MKRLTLAMMSVVVLGSRFWSLVLSRFGSLALPLRPGVWGHSDSCLDLRHRRDLAAPSLQSRATEVFQRR